MKIRWLIVFAILAGMVTACSPKESFSPPEEAYYNFIKACEAEDRPEVETYLTDKAVQAYKKSWLPCETYLDSGVNFASGWVKPDAIEYREVENYDGHEGVFEVVDLTWFVEGNTDPLGENIDPAENTTYISTIDVMLINIDGEWKIDCGWC